MRTELKKVAHILEIMCNENITLEDIQTGLACKASDERKNFHDFDLLVIQDDKKYRLPFEIGKDFNPVGIFPFATSNTYLEFEEVKGARYQIFEERLPEYEFFEKLFEKKEELNARLEQLDKLPLIGKYFTKVSKDMIVWFVGFLKDDDQIKKFGYNPVKHAKARYVGTF